MTVKGPILTVAFAMRPDVFTDVFSPDDLDRLRRVARVLWGPADEARVRADLGPLRDVEVLCTGWGAMVLDEEVLNAAPRLRLVLHAAGSVRRIATPPFWARNIPIVSGHAVNALPVAEFACAQIVYALKQGWRHVLRSREARGPVPRLPMAGTYRSRVGLVSLGAIGTLVANRLARTDIEVLAHDPYADPASVPGVRLVGLDRLFRECDVVSLHAPLLPATRHLVGRELLASMRTGATLVNTARGGLVDENALVDVLRERPDLFAVLDVTDPEPPAAGSPLFTLDNVVVTPHIAGSLGAERARLGHFVVAELERFAAGLPLRHALTQERAALLA